MAKAPPAETVLGVFRKQNSSSASYATYSRQADHEVMISLFQGDVDVCIHVLYIAHKNISVQSV